MIVFPLIAALVAACAFFLGWRALRQPRPEHAVWTVRVLPSSLLPRPRGRWRRAFGWSIPLARVYYLAGAVLVVGILALGEALSSLPGSRAGPRTGSGHP